MSGFNYPLPHPRCDCHSCTQARRDVNSIGDYVAQQQACSGPLDDPFGINGHLRKLVADATIPTVITDPELGKQPASGHASAEWIAYARLHDAANDAKRKEAADLRARELEKVAATVRAQEAWLGKPITQEHLEAAVLAERERAAKIATGPIQYALMPDHKGADHPSFRSGFDTACSLIAARIREGK